MDPFQNEGEIEGAVNYRIQVWWLKRKSASGVIRKKKKRVPLNGKRKQENKLNIVEMRMLWWMSGHTR